MARALIASFALFGFARATFDPTAHLRASRDPHAVERERVRLGLNQPLYKQYDHWLDRAVFHGDFGESSASGEEVSTMISRSMGATLQLIGEDRMFPLTLAGIDQAMRRLTR